jgi:hypothetical protein
MQAINGQNLKNGIKQYFEGIRRCDFRYKIPTLIALSLLVVGTFVDLTPDSLRPIFGVAAFTVTLILGSVKI